MDANNEFIPTRQSLLSRLRDWGDSASWQDFHDTYRNLIFRTALEAGLNPTESEEVVQETMIGVSKAIRKFCYDSRRGSFKSWLRTATTWRIRDHLRREQRRRTESLDAYPDPSDVPHTLDTAEDTIARNWDLAWEQNLIRAAMERVKKKVRPEHFQIFDLAVIKEWPVARIAKTFQVSVGFVYLTKHRLSARLRSEIKKLRRGPCKISDLPEIGDAAIWSEPPIGTIEDGSRRN